MPHREANLHQLEALFNYATIGIVVTDAQARIINFNRCAEGQFGYTRDEVLGKKIEILLPEDYRNSHVHYRDVFFGDPHPRRMGEGRDLNARKKDGTEFPVEVSLTYYTADQTYVIAFIIDITVRKHSEQIVLEQKEELQRVTKEIRQLNAVLEQKVADRTKMLRETLAALEKSKEEVNEALKAEKELGELKSRFVTMASHEFRTPLSTILTSAFLLEKYNNVHEPAKREKHIQRIKIAVGDMRSILEDFLSLGKLEEGLIKATIATVQAEECFAVINDVVHEMEPVFKPGQKIQYTFNGSGEISVDRQLLKNVLMNLLSNASKFSPENGVIKVAGTVTDDQLQIVVQDNGIGISKEDMQHLFERFFRAKNASNIQGTGLGLHIVVKYLDLMNGTIDVQSELNKGTTFTVRIPA
ncbi:PAS domain S-box protein [Ilyomonas limi]|uniref:histidine kinase n=1 Tax=Ilyomonas limi TaxID=2575867 RepID=A0A4U3L964_9BACT|nr:PAS domain-containing sensor histidine kinase [Ilyomonas limi]TKK70247.1 PAS domain S-box protein [Ilyomonas limi]